MSVLLRLPCDLIHDILENWCYLKDLVMLDASVGKCLHSSLLGNFEQLSPIGPSFVGSIARWHAYYQWLFDRRLRLSNLVICSSDIDTYSGKFVFKLDLSSVNTIVFPDYLNKVDKNLFDSCSSLKHVDFYSEKLFLDLHLPLLQLDSVVLRIYVCESPNALFSKLSLCERLKSLTIRAPLSSQLHPLLESLFIAARGLKFVELKTSFDIITIIIERCSCLKTLVLDAIEDSNDNMHDVAGAALTKLPLSSLVLKYNFSTIEYSSEKKSLIMEHARISSEMIDFISSTSSLLEFILTTHFHESLDDVIMALYGSVSSLKKLSLDRGGVVSITAIKSFIGVSPKLEILHCSFDESSETEDMSTIFRNQHCLREIRLDFSYHCKMLNIFRIIQQCPLLSYFAFFEVIKDDEALDLFEKCILERYQVDNTLHGTTEFVNEELGYSDRYLSFKNGISAIRCL